ncbi:hypothetical protein ABEB36_005531 [Hypothenemus hampei]|uniref:Laccase n=1 Tax=Hypothenemus hampei TaxID=57062 RepID=A0ABD1EYM3_HYPHA
MKNKQLVVVLLLLPLIAFNVTFVLSHSNNIQELEVLKVHQKHYNYKFEEESHPCTRKCILGEKPKICQYNFTIENYYTMTKACHACPKNITDCFRTDCIFADGKERGVVGVNRKIPGPSIEVCQNDIIVVDVKNQMMSEGVTIHWHGQHMLETPYMDGVPYVTQCPILPRTTFRYTFKAAQAGTHFWHSHTGMQRTDGCFGPLIVRIPDEENPHDPQYDFDLSAHIIVLIDWEHVTGIEKFLYHHHSIGDNKPPVILVNGMGKSAIVENNKTLYEMPLARFSVEQGYRYRFRVINAGFLNCPIEMSVDNHTIKVISTDGNDVSPIEADSLVTYAGERFDFVLSADQPKALYWMRFRGLMDCDERYKKAFQVAVLEYQGYSRKVTGNDVAENVTESTDDELSNNVVDTVFHNNNSNINNRWFGNLENDDFPNSIANYDNSIREGKQINSLNWGTEADTNVHITIPKLSSVQKWDHRLKLKPDYQFYLAYDFYTIDNKHFYGPGYEFRNVSARVLTPQINHISMKMPNFPLLSQRNEVPKNMFCTEETVKGENCSKTYCECPHVYQIPVNSLVELIIVDEGFAYNANHPLHLHGYSFRVVAMERVGENVTVAQIKQKDKKGLIKRNLLDAPVKDTVTVPDGGYTVVRFQATNPGFWMFHCHLEFHAEIGMALVFKIGENDEMPPVPEGFPRCGNYIPSNISWGEKQTECSRNFIVNQLETLFFKHSCQSETSGTDVSHFKYRNVIIVFATILAILGY